MAAPSLAPAETKTERLHREVAHRVFAAEFNAATLEFKEGGERAPSFVVTPLGARINRMLVVGVLTRNEGAGNGESYRFQVVDPTGTLYGWAGQYEPEASAALSELQPPSLVAIVGKGRIRQVEATSDKPAAIYQSVRPEAVVRVEMADRDAWILDAARHTLLRLDCMKEASRMQKATVPALIDLGYPEDLADGVVRALAHYGTPDLAKWAAMVRDAVEVLLPGGAARMPEPTFTTASSLASAPRAPAAAAAPAPPPVSEERERIEEEVLELVGRLDDGKGAPWEDVLSHAGKKKIGESEVEEALNALMDRGLVYEPVLGRLKKT